MKMVKSHNRHSNNAVAEPESSKMPTPIGVRKAQEKRQLAKIIWSNMITDIANNIKDKSKNDIATNSQKKMKEEETTRQSIPHTPIPHTGSGIRTTQAPGKDDTLRHYLFN